jgi:hypothetical protein
MTENKSPERRKLKVATCLRSGETNLAGEAIFDVRLYTAGRHENSISVPSSLLQEQLDVLRAHGYEVNWLES